MQTEGGSDLQLQGGLSCGCEGQRLPVHLLHLLPHHHVEAGRVLVPEDKPGIVVIRNSVDMKRPLEVNAIKRSVSCRYTEEDTFRTRAEDRFLVDM